MSRSKHIDQVIREDNPVMLSKGSLLYGVVLCAISLILSQEKALSHPQCLDFRAPFKVAEQLSFCPQNYSEYGCCTVDRDRRIFNDYRRLATRFSLDSKPKCANLVKTVLCLECHEYAAHIFEAEGNEKFDSTTAAPGLCSNFCRTFYQECKDVATYLLSTGRWKLRSTPEDSSLAEESFCNGLQLSDADYCYPHVQTVDREILSKKYNLQSNRNCLCVEEVARGLRNPLAAVHANDESGRLFIAEQPGLIRIISPDGKLLQQPFLDITDRVLSSGSYGDERGFLSIVFHPAFRNTNRFFVYYSTRMSRKSGKRKNSEAPFTAFDHRTVLSEFRASVYNRNRALRRSEKVLMEIKQPADNHNGGTLFFGSDGLLYLTIGDGGQAGDPFGKIGNGLNRSTLLGSIIRIDVDARRYSYKIPSDNPFIGIRGVRPEIYAYGTRNMWRCSVDRGDRKTGEGKGRIFCGDVGQNKYEEIDIISKGGNYGWRGFEGFECFDKNLCSSSLVNGSIPPIFAYNHSVGKSVVGGHVYRGCKNPDLSGKYIFGDTVTSRFFALTEDKSTGAWKDEELCFGDDKYCTDNLSGEFERFILSFGEDEHGELYFLSTSRPSSTSKEGKVYRIIDPGRRRDPANCSNSRPSTSSCKDRRGSKNFCEYFKSRNKCNVYKRYFKKKCKKTCGFC